MGGPFEIFLFLSRASLGLSTLCLIARCMPRHLQEGGLANAATSGLSSLLSDSRVYAKRFLVDLVGAAIEHACDLPQCSTTSKP